MFTLTLLLLALVLNKNSRNKILLVLALGAGFLAPVNLLVNYYYLWFIVVISMESAICYLALKLDENFPLFVVSLLLCFLHIIQCFYNKIFGYYIVANILELLQVISLIITSPIIITKIKGRIKCLQKFGCGY